jgi:hypothetical protein
MTTFRLVERIALVAVLPLMLSSCVTFMGLPGHGGGKRLDIEQELVSATARAVARDLDVTPLVGKKCALYLVAIGDQGAGNFVGGQYDISAVLGGSYMSAPMATSSTNNVYPVTTTTTTRTTSDSFNDTMAENTTIQNALNSPTTATTTSSQNGTSHSRGGELRFSASPTYRSEAFINAGDVQFLNAIVHEAFFLKGVRIVPAHEADVNVYITVDIFGTRRTQDQFYLVKNDNLLAKTALEVTAVDRAGTVIMAPRVSSFEAEYREKYFLWMGPFSITKGLRRSDALLADFTGMTPSGVSEDVVRVVPFPVNPGEILASSSRSSLAITISDTPPARDSMTMDLKDALYNAAVLAYNGSRFPEAIRDFRKVMTLAPDDDDALFYLGMSYYKSGNRESALACFRGLRAGSTYTEHARQMAQAVTR